MVYGPLSFFVGYSYLEGFAVYNEVHQVSGGALHYLETQNFTEPVFVFVIMCMAATRPVVLLAEKFIWGLAKVLPLNQRMSFYLATMILGPLMGSMITEPAAMTLTAMILLDYFYSQKMSQRFKYATLGLLFVNISIGGTLTHFAAPPVLMVASKYGWDMNYMMTHFGWKATISILVTTVLTVVFFKKELEGEIKVKKKEKNLLEPTWWIYLSHLIFLALTVSSSHHMVFLWEFFCFLRFYCRDSRVPDADKVKGITNGRIFFSGSCRSRYNPKVVASGFTFTDEYTNALFWSNSAHCCDG